LSGVVKLVVVVRLNDGQLWGGSDLSHLEGRVWALLISDSVVMVYLGVKKKRREGERRSRRGGRLLDF
jgi:hypothetical protein